MILGYLLFSGQDTGRGWAEAFAAGALIALMVETMAPEAVVSHPAFTGLLPMLFFSALLVAPQRLGELNGRILKSERIIECFTRGWAS